MSEYTKDANQMLDEEFGATRSDLDHDHFTDSDSDSQDYPSTCLWHGVSSKFSSIILLDDKEMFLSFMEEQYPSAAMEGLDTRTFPLCEKYFMCTCQFEAVSCATALLEGETSATVDPNHHFPSGRYPLHYAAGRTSYALVDLLLRHGARTDVETTQVEGRCRGGLLPLNVALETLRTHRYLVYWNQKPYPSLLKMICIFCLPQMKAPLEICRLLASNMDDADVVKLFHSYCMHGDFVEMAALLMASRKKLIDRSSGSISVCKFIARETERLNNEEITLLWNSRPVLSSRKKIMHLKDTLFLLGIFEKFGETIDSYVKTVGSHTSKEKVVDDIKMFLVAGGLPMKPRDTNLRDIDCEHAEIKLATEILEKMLQSPSYGHSDVTLGTDLEDLARRLGVPDQSVPQHQKWANGIFFPFPNDVFMEGGNTWFSTKRSASYRQKHKPPPTLSWSYGPNLESPQTLYGSYLPKHPLPTTLYSSYMSPTCSGPVDKMAPLHYSAGGGYTSVAWAMKKWAMKKRRR